MRSAPCTIDSTFRSRASALKSTIPVETLPQLTSSTQMPWIATVRMDGWRWPMRRQPTYTGLQIPIVIQMSICARRLTRGNLGVSGSTVCCSAMTHAIIALTDIANALSAFTCAEKYSIATWHATAAETYLREGPRRAGRISEGPQRAGRVSKSAASEGQRRAGRVRKSADAAAEEGAHSAKPPSSH